VGFDWANHHRGRVRALPILRVSLRALIASWTSGALSATPIFQAFVPVSFDKGEAMILDRNVFVERVLPGSGALSERLTEAGMTEISKALSRRAMIAGRL